MPERSETSNLAACGTLERAAAFSIAGCAAPQRDGSVEIVECAPMCGFIPQRQFELPGGTNCGGPDNDVRRYDFSEVRFSDPWRGVALRGRGDGYKHSVTLRDIGRNANIVQLMLDSTNVFAGDERLKCHSVSHDWSEVSLAAAKPNAGVRVQHVRDIFGWSAAGSLWVTNCVQIGTIQGVYASMIGAVYDLPQILMDWDGESGHGCGNEAAHYPRTHRVPLFRGDGPRDVVLRLSGTAACRVELERYRWSGSAWGIAARQILVEAHESCDASDIGGEYTITLPSGTECLVTLLLDQWNAGQNLGRGAATIVIEDIE